MKYNYYENCFCVCWQKTNATVIKNYVRELVCRILQLICYIITVANLGNAAELLNIIVKGTLISTHFVVVIIVFK